MATWGIAQAKARLSEVVHNAEKLGPQRISRSGREVAVVISIQELERLQSRLSPETAPPQPGALQPGVGALAEILKNSPLYGSGFEIPSFRGRDREDLF